MPQEPTPPTQVPTSAGYTSGPPTTPVYPKPPRLALGVQSGGRQGGYFNYTGQNLVGLNNRIERQPYDISADYVRSYWADLSTQGPAERVKTFSIMKQYGLLSGDPNDFDNQLQGIANLLDFANTTGFTAERALLEIQKIGRPVGGGGGAMRRYRVSSPDDLRAVANKVALDTLGRSLTEEESVRFVQAYQQREVQAQQQYYAGGTVTEAPSAGVAAETFATQIAPTEANGYKFLKIMNRINELAQGGQ